MKKPLAYIRVSSTQQVEKGFSLENQKDSILAHCKIYNLPEPEFVVDEGLSARTTKKRPGVNYILNKIRSGEADTIFAYNLSRMFRNVVDTLNFIDLIEKKNVKFVAVTEKYETVTASGKLHITMIAAFYRMMSDKISEDTKDILRNKKSKKQTYCKHLTGFDNVEGNLVPNKHMDTVNQIKDLTTKNNSPYSIAKMLNQAGVKTIYGKTFHPTSVKRIAQNQVYA